MAVFVGRTDASTKQLIQFKKMFGIDIDTLLTKDLKSMVIDFNEVRKRIVLYSR